MEISSELNEHPGRKCSPTGRSNCFFIIMYTIFHRWTLFSKGQLLSIVIGRAEISKKNNQSLPKSNRYSVLWAFENPTPQNQENTQGLRYQRDGWLQISWGLVYLFAGHSNKQSSHSFTLERDLSHDSSPYKLSYSATKFKTLDFSQLSPAWLCGSSWLVNEYRLNPGKNHHTHPPW